MKQKYLKKLNKIHYLVLAAVFLIATFGGYYIYYSQAKAPLQPLGRSGLPWNSAAYHSNGSQAPRAETFGDWRGRQQDYMLEFATRKTWSSMDDFYDQTFLDWPGGHIIAIPTQPKWKEGTQQDKDNSETASGSRNWWWEDYGKKINNLGLNKSTTIFRLNWESTGDWYPWRINKSTADTFLKAYKNVVKSVKKHSPNVKFTFGLATNKWFGPGTWQEFADKLGPNQPDGFDYIELDGYDQFPDAPNSTEWNKQSNLNPGRNSVYEYAKSRQVPMWYGEWGVTHKTGGGGDNPYYIQQKYNWFLQRAIGNGGWFAGETYFNVPGAPSTYKHTLYNTRNKTIDSLNRNSALKYKELWSKDVNYTPSPPDPTPDPSPDPSPAPDNDVLNPVVTQQSSSAVLISWSEVTNATSYRVGRDGTDTTGSGPWSTTDPAGTTSRLFDKLDLANQTYTFTVEALSSSGTIISSETVDCCDTGGSNPDPDNTTSDLNQDGKVDIVDLSILLSDWDKTGVPSDLNQDGKVDIVDLSTLLSDWGS